MSVVLNQCLLLRGNPSVLKYGARNMAAGFSSPRRPKTLEEIKADEERGVFRVLDIGLPKKLEDRKRRSREVNIKATPREQQMKPSQDWGSVWPAPKTFHPAVVPLPVRQGFVQLKDQVVPAKEANVELMKIPNFLHLTPPVIKKHCQALKSLCTKWPEDLDEDAQADVFPVTEVTTDYLNASSSIRDDRARLVSVITRLESLQLDARSLDKFLRLVAERVNFEDLTVAIESDKCPYRVQNSEYCSYLLTACYFESLQHESWEQKAESDCHAFDWTAAGESVEMAKVAKDESFKEAVKTVLNQGEDKASLTMYKDAVRKMYGLKNEVPDTSAEVI